MHARSRRVGGVIAAALAIVFGLVVAPMAQGCGSRDGKSGCCAATTTAAKAQTKCPVQGNKIDKTAYVDVKGYRVYLCCQGCAAKVKEDPDKYIAVIKANGEQPEQAPVAVEKAAAEEKPAAM